MSKVGTIAIGLMIEKLQEFLEWIFQPRKKSVTEELGEVDSFLKEKFGLNVQQIIKLDLDYVTAKIDRIEVRTLDKMMVLVYSCIKSNKESKFSIELKTQTNLNLRLMELIAFAERKSEKLSLERNNLKNSLQQQLE